MWTAAKLAIHPADALRIRVSDRPAVQTQIHAWERDGTDRAGPITLILKAKLLMWTANAKLAIHPAGALRIRVSDRPAVQTQIHAWERDGTDRVGPITLILKAKLLIWTGAKLAIHPAGALRIRVSDRPAVQTQIHAWERDGTDRAGPITLILKAKLLMWTANAKLAIHPADALRLSRDTAGKDDDESPCEHACDELSHRGSPSKTPVCERSLTTMPS